MYAGIDLMLRGIIADFASSPGGILLFTVIAALVVAGCTWLIRARIWPRLRARRIEREKERRSIMVVEELAVYLAHVRDFVMPMVVRARGASKDEIRKHIHEGILEPIRDNVPKTPQ